MAQAKTPTLLGLDRAAEIVGFDLVHFNGGHGDEYHPIATDCDDVMPQWGYQRRDAISREELARNIAAAEDEIGKQLGYSVAPSWVVDEWHLYKKGYRIDSGTARAFTHPIAVCVADLNVAAADFQFKSVRPKWGKFIAHGRRTTELIDQPSISGGEIVISDSNGDGFDDLVTITVTLTTAEAIEEYHLFHTGENALPEWEIKPLLTSSITGLTLVMTIGIWDIIDPDALSAAPSGEDFRAIDVTSLVNLINALDIYRVYNDSTVASVEFFWEGQTTTQTGVLYETSDEVIKVVPASFDSDTELWTTDTWLHGGEPDKLRIWYYAGDFDQNWPSIRTDPMKHFWAEAVTWIAFARFNRHVFPCGNLSMFTDELRVDASIQPLDSNQRNQPFDVLDNPFGTHIGEIMAWRKVQHFALRRGKMATIA